jgi:hypothetical protein
LCHIVNLNYVHIRYLSYHKTFTCQGKSGREFSGLRSVQLRGRCLERFSRSSGSHAELPIVPNGHFFLILSCSTTRQPLRFTNADMIALRRHRRNLCFLFLYREACDVIKQVIYGYFEFLERAKAQHD